MKPLPRHQSIAPLRPNPMSIIGTLKACILRNALFGNLGDVVPIASTLRFERPALSTLPISELKFIKKSLPRYHSKGFNKILIHGVRNSTIQHPSYIDIDGNKNSVLNTEEKPFRQYFDGKSFAQDGLAHCFAGCITFDFDKNGEPFGRIVTQDSQGIPVPDDCRDLFANILPNFELEDLQIKQQWDAHSCSVITLYNQECFARGIIPSSNVDTEKLRARYWQILDDLSRADGYSPDHPTRYYTGADPMNVPYIPI